MAQDLSMFDMTGAPADFGREFAPDAQLFGSEYATANFTSINDPVGAATVNQGTISPKDLMMDPSASAPPSGAFTNLTSPSIFDSPDVNDSFETSPMFTNSGDSDLPSEPWFSLFPNTSTESDASPPNPSAELQNLDRKKARGAAASKPDAGSRRRSSPGQSPQNARNSSAGKHSSVSGVSSRRRDKPLPPIEVDDPSDVVAMKRARNTMAARKSRQKRVERFEELEKNIEDLKAEVAHWKQLALGQQNGP